jgi:hypothetical protein
MKHLYTILILIPLFFVASCDDVLKEVDFSVTTEKTSYTVGEEVVFNIVNAPDWVTFYSGEEGKSYPDSYGASIKNMRNELFTYSYSYSNPGTYKVVFVGGNTNYQGSKEQTVTLTLTIK